EPVPHRASRHLQAGGADAQSSAQAPRARRAGPSRVRRARVLRSAPAEWPDAARSRLLQLQAGAVAARPLDAGHDGVDERAARALRARRIARPWHRDARRRGEAFTLMPDDALQARRRFFAELIT